MNLLTKHNKKLWAKLLNSPRWDHNARFEEHLNECTQNERFIFQTRYQRRFWIHWSLSQNKHVPEALHTSYSKLKFIFENFKNQNKWIINYQKKPLLMCVFFPSVNTILKICLLVGNILKPFVQHPIETL